MDSRERVKSAIEGRRPDRLPVHEDFWMDTLPIWKTQGLPVDLNYDPPEDPTSSLDGWINEYFDFDVAVMYLDASPRAPQKILGRDGDWYSYTDRWGYTARKLWERSGTIEYLETCNVNRGAWDELAKGFTLAAGDTARIDDRNYFEHFLAYPSWEGAKAKYDRLRERDRYILFKDYGPWEGLWRHREFTRSLMDLATDPGWITEMAITHHNLRKEVLERSFAEGMVPDGFLMVDDLGSSHGPLISPTMFREIFKPLYADLGAYLAERGIAFWLHCCGNTEVLFDDYIECGISVMNPMQVSAGLDAVDLRKRYGKKLSFYGNVDAHLLDGDGNELTRQVSQRIEAFRDGGWVYHSDHSVPPTMPCDRFQGVLNLIRIA